MCFDGKKSREIHTFIKDAYGCPYVPGSSVKGMLRTILLAGKILKNPERFQNNKVQFQKKLRSKDGGKRDKYLSQEIKDLETAAFHKLSRREDEIDDAVNDIFSAIRISDSKPLSTEDLILCQKVDLSLNGGEHDLPMVRECLRPVSYTHLDVYKRQA